MIEQIITAATNDIKEMIQRNGSIKAAITEISDFFNSIGEPPIEIVNYLKSIVQQEALTAWKDNGCRGIIAMATGTGKSRIPINYMYKDIVSLGILIVPTEKLRDNNWEEEFKKVDNCDAIYDNLGRFCYASINKINNTYWKLAILDEVHNITENNSEFFLKNRVDEIMALTATVPTDPVKLKILSDLNLPVVYELTLDEAVKLRLVSPYEITIVETNLDSNYVYIEAGNKKKPFKITEVQAYKYLNEKIDKLEPRINLPKPTDFEGGFGFVDDNIGMHRGLTEKEQKSLTNLIMKRMKFIYDLKGKYNCAEWIKHNILTVKTNEGEPDQRTIFFCGSINQANNICIYNYHSKSKSDEGLQRFINKQTNYLACVDSLNEGMNLPDVDNAVIIQCNSNEKDLIQRIGRAIRFRTGHIAKIIIIVCKNTVDEKWVDNAIQNLDSTKIKRISFANLKVGNEKL